jgi:hypothetical protein
LEARRFDGGARRTDAADRFLRAKDFPLAGVCKGRKNFHTDDVHNDHFMPKGSIIMPNIWYAIPSFLSCPFKLRLYPRSVFAFFRSTSNTNTCCSI